MRKKGVLMPLPPFEPNGDLPEGLHQAYVTRAFTKRGLVEVKL